MKHPYLVSLTEEGGGDASTAPWKAGLVNKSPMTMIKDL